MPLPPLPPNNTARVWIKYVTGGAASSQEHEVMLRFNPEAASPVAVMERFHAVLVGFGTNAFRTGWHVVSARAANAGASFSLPVQPPAGLLGFQGSNGAEGYNGSWEAIEDTCQGRSGVSGRRVDFSLYRAAGAIDNTFRYGMPGAVATALSVGAGAEEFLCIDGTPPSWYTYVNQNYNSYWERQLRS